MIQTFEIKNFKCFQNETLEFRPLVLVVGTNAAGKSSLIQALLLLQMAANTNSTYVRLNGPQQLQLGKTDDVLCQSGARQADVLFNVNINGVDYSLKLTGDVGALVLMVHKPSNSVSFELAYLGAERLGPRDTLDSDSVANDDLGVGVQGEFVAQVLAAHERDRVSEDRRHPNTQKEGNVIQLAKQVELWMQDLAPGIEIRTIPLMETNLHAMRFRRRDAGTEWLRPANIGFGVSYALPIIVAGLLAKPGSLFLVENPEAHLHPAGQSRMGRFLATLAAAGVQVIIETHSDHILNGIRLAAVDTHPLRHTDVIIHHFHGDEGRPTRTEPIEVTAKGGLSKWPAGFFDQSEKDLAAIVAARRQVKA